MFTISAINTWGEVGDLRMRKNNFLVVLRRGFRESFQVEMSPFELPRTKKRGARICEVCFGDQPVVTATWSRPQKEFVGLDSGLVSELGITVYLERVPAIHHETLFECLVTALTYGRGPMGRQSHLVLRRLVVDGCPIRISPNVRHPIDPIKAEFMNVVPRR
jgi:hypothetical protein